MIAVYCTATVCSQADALQMSGACHTQVMRDLALAWNRLAPQVRYFADRSRIPAGVPTILIADVCDDPEALAYHTEGTDGRISGLVGAKTILDAGGTILEGELSISAALSHEVCETVIDPFVDAWVQRPDGQLVALEVCDPVQDQAYAIDGVSVSNFVCGHWFDDRAPAGAKFDHLGSLSSAFSRSSGGYWVEMRAGKVSQVGAARPPWKPRAPQSRTMSRVVRSGALVA